MWKVHHGMVTVGMLRVSFQLDHRAACRQPLIVADHVGIGIVKLGRRRRSRSRRHRRGHTSTGGGLTLVGVFFDRRMLCDLLHRSVQSLWQYFDEMVPIFWCQGIS